MTVNLFDNQTLPHLNGILKEIFQHHMLKCSLISKADFY